MVYRENHPLSPEPLGEIPSEDAWAYTVEHLRQVEQAQADIRAGRIVRMTENELIAFIAEHTGEVIKDS